MISMTVMTGARMRWRRMRIDDYWCSYGWCLIWISKIVVELGSCWNSSMLIRFLSLLAHQSPILEHWLSLSHRQASGGTLFYLHWSPSCKLYPYLLPGTIDKNGMGNSSNTYWLPVYAMVVSATIRRVCDTSFVDVYTVYVFNYCLLKIIVLGDC